jgi:predicted transcriptional regulator
MKLTKTQLYVFLEIIKQKNKVSLICKDLNKSRFQINKVIRQLIEKRFIIKEKYLLNISNYPFSLELKFLLTKFPKLITVLSDNGLILLISFLKESTVKEISVDTKIKEITIYKFINKANNFSILIKRKNKYLFNEKLWGDLKSFLLNYKSFNYNFDSKVPIGSKIYYKNKDEIVFSYEKDLDWASITAFTAFQKYNILLFSNIGYYYLPKKRLTKKEILFHTVKIVEKTMDFREILYLALFYYKYKIEFKNINLELKSNILNNLDQIYLGEKIKGYPPLNEIQEKAELYDIKL